MSIPDPATSQPRSEPVLPATPAPSDDTPGAMSTGGRPPQASPWLFGESFIREVLYWSIGTAAAGGLIGWLLTAEMAFAIGLWVGAAIDIATFRSLALHGFERMQGDGAHGLSASVLFVRFAAKGLLLLGAGVFASSAAFWGVFAGILIVEFMLVVVGIFRSATDVFRSRSRPGTRVHS